MERRQRKSPRGSSQSALDRMEALGFALGLQLARNVGHRLPSSAEPARGRRRSQPPVSLRPRPAVEASLSTVAGQFVRGDRIWYQSGVDVLEGEVMRISADGRLVVSPISGEPRLLLEVDRVV